MKEYFHQNEIPMTPPGPVFPGRLAAEQFPSCVPASCPLKLLSAATVSQCWAGTINTNIFHSVTVHCGTLPIIVPVLLYNRPSVTQLNNN